MSAWLLVALVPPALFAVSNYIDKYLLERYFEHQGNGALLAFSALVGLAALPPILAFDRGVLDIALSDAVLIMVSGIAYLVALLPYFAAMRDEEASVAAPLFQLIPLFGYAFGYVMLGERFTAAQLGAAALIVLGGFVLSVETTPGAWRFKARTFGLMAVSSALMALSSVMFKYFALDGSYWATSFWTYAGLGSAGLFMLAFMPRVRREFTSVFRSNGVGAVSLNVLNEAVNLAGMLVLNYALLLAPVTYVFLAGAAQPLFILAYGVILTALLPRVITERLDRRVLIQKGIAVLLLIAGAFLLDRFA